MAPTMTATNLQPVSLTEVLNKAGGAIRAAFPASVWVRAEISEWKVSGAGHAYITLVEHDDAGQECAKASAKIWRTALAAIAPRFRAGAGSDLRAGIKVMVRAKIEMTARYGFSITIEDVDPNYTAGDMAAKLAAMRQVLTEEGIFRRQRDLPPPRNFTRVAVLAPEAAAGLGDFMADARRLQQAGLIELEVFSAVFQGEHAAASLVKGLVAFFNSHRAKAFDVLCIIRGGGAAADLAWLNDLQVAKLVCKMPIPVFTGIGHERDTCIIDEVGHTRFDTPSKVIAHISGHIVAEAREAERVWLEVTSAANRVLADARHQVHQRMADVEARAGQLVGRAEIHMEQSYAEILANAMLKPQRAKEQIDGLLREVIGLGPRATLARGFSMVRKGGRTVGSRQDLRAGDRIQIAMSDGHALAVIEDTAGTSGGGSTT